jgi:vitamin B12 transporter
VESHATFDSNRAQALVQNDVALSEADTLTLGLESALERGNSVETYSAGGPDVGLKDKDDLALAGFVQDQWLSDTFFATAGARYDAHRDLDSKATYRIAPGLRLPGSGTTFRASVGTGFKVPSLYQRFSSYGDPSLKPETSLSFDAGVEQQVGSQGKVGLTYFHTGFGQLIDYDFRANHYINIGQATTEGVEATASYAASRRLQLTSTYTFLVARDDTTGLWLPRRPRHQLSLGAEERLTDRAQFGAEARFVGSRDDLDAVSGNRVGMPAYAVFYLTARYQVSKDFRVFGRVDNLLDRAYEEINGFGTPGRSFFLGVAEEI